MTTFYAVITKLHFTALYYLSLDIACDGNYSQTTKIET